jgi:hypothetical protein
MELDAREATRKKRKEIYEGNKGEGRCDSSTTNRSEVNTAGVAWGSSLIWNPQTEVRHVTNQNVTLKRDPKSIR